MGTSGDTNPPGWLQEWLARLDAADFHIGLRERLLAHALLARLALAGALPRAPVEAARLLGPLLCSSQRQQQAYAELLKSWPGLQQAGSAALAPLPGAGQGLAAAPAVQAWIWPLLMIALVVASVLAWRQGPDAAQGGPAAPARVASAAQADSAPAGQPPPAQTAASAPDRPGIYLLARELPLLPAQPPAWSGPLRQALGGLGVLGACLVLLAWWRQRRRAMVLKGVRSNEQVQEHVLREKPGSADPLAPPPALLRPASRLLRQRMAGPRAELDLRATIRATIDAGGALVARWRTLAQTPEYLVLIDSRGAADHLVRYQRALVDALAAQNVALTVFEFEGSPAQGCWRVRAGDGPQQRFDRSSLAELSARHAGQRLLVFADPGIALDPRSGQPLPWATQLKRDFPAAAWFSPRPLVSWGTAEIQVAERHDLGFLLLPVQHEALDTVAGWFASERAHLQLPPDLPGPWPAQLGDDSLGSAMRHSPPPAAEIDLLLHELRHYLGAWRFQWLAACAAFPVLSWPLSLGLGAALRGPEGEDEGKRALALGMAALGPLPWFRHGRMPQWLRQALVERLSADNERRCRALIEQRLDAALTQGGGPELVKVATRRAWLSRGRGVARDLVLVDFLQRGELLSRLVQRLPEGLRRGLFRRGRPAYGLQPGWWSLPALAMMAALLAWTPLWQQWLRQDGVQQMAEADGALPPATAGAAVASLALSPDGLRLLALERAADGAATLRWMSARGQPLQPALADVPQRLQAAALNAGGSQIALLTGPGALGVWRASDGRSFAATAFTSSAGTAIAFDSRSDAVAVGAGGGAIHLSRFSGNRPLRAASAGRAAVSALAYSADGSLLAALDAQGLVDLLSLPDGRAASALPTGRRFVAMAFAARGSRLWLADDSGQLRPWDARLGAWAAAGVAAAGGGAQARVLATDPGGLHLAVGWSDGSVTLHAANSGALLARARLPGAAAVTALAFSPDGGRLLSGGSDGQLRWWGAPRGVPLRIVGCKADEPAALAAAWPSLFTDNDDDGRTAVDAIAYTQQAAQDGGQWPDLQPGEVAHDPADARQSALARQVLARLQVQPGRDPGRWRLRAVPGALAVTAQVCGGDDAVPPSAQPLAKMRFEVIECTPTDAAAGAVVARVQQALRRLGAADVRRTSASPAVLEKTFGTPFASYEIRGRLGQADDDAAAQVLLADPGFVGGQTWRRVSVAQRGAGPMRVLVCPGALFRGDAGASAPAPAIDANAATQAGPAPVPPGSRPSITLVSPADVTVRVPSVDISYTLSSPADAPVTGVKALIGGTVLTVDPQPDFRNGAVRVASIPVSAALSEVQLVAENRHGASQPVSVRVGWWDAANGPSKPRLFVLAIGVSRYGAAGIEAMQFPAKDARDFAAFMQRQGSKVFSSVETHVLVDRQASRQAILDGPEGLDWLQRQTTQHDVAMLFVAGHAVNDDELGFTFLPFDADPERLRTTAVRMSRITGLLSAVAGRTAMFIDACSMGYATGAKSRSLGSALQSALSDAASSENGVTVFSACDGGQTPVEPGGSPNGVFTTALLEGLAGAADANKSGIVSASELGAYVRGRVRSLTKSTQTPLFLSPRGAQEFPLTLQEGLR